MALIDWTEDLSVGVAEIDRQHQELFFQVNQLLEACHQAKGKEAVGKIVGFLENYVVRHFAKEEDYMTIYRYPGMEGHRADHQRFTEGFAELKRRFEAEGPGVHIVVMINHAVVDWLNSHIRNVDKALGEFLRNRFKPAD